MNIDRLQASLAVSFHDSLLHSYSIDLVGRTATFLLDFWIGDLDSDDPKVREQRRLGRLELTGVEYVVVDPPDPKYPYRDAEPADMDICAPDPQVVARYPVANGAFSARFFVSTWNAFIHFAAMAADLTWQDEAKSPGT